MLLWPIGHSRCPDCVRILKNIISYFELRTYLIITSARRAELIFI